MKIVPQSREKELEMKKIKVLQSVYSLGIGGNQIFTMNYYRHINKEKFQVDFLIFDRKLDFYDEVINGGSKVYIAPKMSECGKITECIRHMKFVYQVLKENDYDIIHIHNCSLLGLIYSVIPAKLNGKVKIITHSHSEGVLKNLFGEKIMRTALKTFLSHNVDLGFACSDIAGENKYNKKFCMSEKYFIIPNAVDTEKFAFNAENRKEIRQKFNISDEEIVVGNVGRLSNEKNQKFLIEILRYMRSVQDNSKVLIVGGGELEYDLKNLALELGVKNNLIITGAVNDVYKYYSAMDVFVMPSLYEGLPFTAVEAQANGLKCVFADKISRMSNISGDVTFLSLQDSLSIWREKIFDAGSSRSDSEHIQQVRNRYNLNVETRKIEQKYKCLVKRDNK